jgi:hypothetical protein
MPLPNEIKQMTEEVVASFDSGIGAVGLLIEKGLEILDGYRNEEAAVRGSLRDSLASIGSLRRKDFDGVMEKILAFQAEREGEIKSLIKGFLTRQRELARRIQRSLGSGIFQEVEKGKRELGEMIDQARGEILSFQQEQGKIREVFAQLKSHQEGMSIRDFKKAIQDLEVKLLGRPPQEERRAAV